MTTEKQLDAFYGELQKLIIRYQQEFDLSDAELIGGLQMFSALFAIQSVGWCIEDDEDEDYEEEDEEKEF
jgi:hypothetical protein|tara:strand:+ start:196 stop:405 length:210 start_codon:yes stop_codon:yes gene_type:complete